jgi:hypothetical protein
MGRVDAAEVEPAERRWLGVADVRVIGLRVLLLAVASPLLALGYATLARQAWADRIAQRLLGIGLLSPPSWFWRFALFMAVVIIIPLSVAERLALRWTPLTRGRALAAALLAGALIVPCALLALGQTQYAPDALAGRPDEASGRALEAVREVVTQPARELLGAALAFMSPFVVLTWCRLRGVRLRVTWPATVALSAAAAALALHGVAGLPVMEWLMWRTDFWTAVTTAALVPPAFALVDRLDAAWWPGSVASGRDVVD